MSLNIDRIPNDSKFPEGIVFKVNEYIVKFDDISEILSVYDWFKHREDAQAHPEYLNILNGFEYILKLTGKSA